MGGVVQGVMLTWPLVLGQEKNLEMVQLARGDHGKENVSTPLLTVHL